MRRIAANEFIARRSRYPKLSWVKEKCCVLAIAVLVNGRDISCGEFVESVMPKENHGVLCAQSS